MSYDNLHNITSKKQYIAQTDVAFEGNLLAGYELEYNYRTDKPHQLEYIKDNNYRTADSTAVASSTKAISDAYSYDSNGNLIFVNSNDSVQTNIKERQLSWDEENRLRSICDNGYVSSYFYDAAGERTVKLHGGAEGIHVNSAFSGGYTNNADYTLYVNAYMVLEKGGQYTKHIYIGDQRIVSKLGDVGSFGIDPRREQYAGEDVAGVEVPDYASKYDALQDVIKDNYATFEVDYYGADNDNYVAGEGFCCGDNSMKTKSISDDSPSYEKLQYYYHSDHLGSASYITNLDGEVVQHIEYVPFGEVFLEERNNTWNTPFLFNGKELDEETGLYYYGARYYNPRISLWYGVDPLAEKYPNFSPYAYTFNNPIRYIDPTGMEGEEPEQNKKNPAEIARDKYVAMIADSRSKGHNEAADNLQRWLDGTGGTKDVDAKWLKSFKAIRNAQDKNIGRFEEQIEKIALSLKDQESKSLNDYWDAALTGSPLTELFYASGTSQITSKGHFFIKRNGSKITVTGSIEHEWNDPYDWHDGLSAYIPGHGVINDSDALLVQEEFGAKPFHMRSTWTNKVNTSSSIWFKTFLSIDLNND